jgi:hypothetical protein
MNGTNIVRMPYNSDLMKPSTFIFYAFRTYNLDLAISLVKSFRFDINERNENGYTVLRILTLYININDPLQYNS